jgi:hypothetical protein
MLGKSLIVVPLAGLVAGAAHEQGDPLYAIDTGLGAASASPGDPSEEASPVLTKRPKERSSGMIS